MSAANSLPSTTIESISDLTLPLNDYAFVEMTFDLSYNPEFCSRQMAGPADSHKYDQLHQQPASFSLDWPSTSAVVDGSDYSNYQIEPTGAHSHGLLVIQPNDLSLHAAFPAGYFTGSAPQDESVPRSFPSDLVSGNSTNLQEQTFPPAAFQLQSFNCDPLLDFSHPHANSRPDLVFRPERTAPSESPYIEPVDSIENTTGSSWPIMMSSVIPEEATHLPHHAASGTPTPDDQTTDKEQPYAKLIYQCLRNAPNNCMVLKDIYRWFKENTDKGNDPNAKGWQNSIRHNLSMNKAFVKVEQDSVDESRRGFMWRLSNDAIKDGGVQSTTRYRNKQPSKRGAKSQNPAPYRQASGSKGGEMSRKASALRRSERLREVTQTLHNSGRDLREAGVIRSCENLDSQLRDDHQYSLNSHFMDIPPRPPTPLSCDGDESRFLVSISSDWKVPSRTSTPRSNPSSHMPMYSGMPTITHLGDPSPYGFLSYVSSPEISSHGLDAPEEALLVGPERIFYDSTPDSFTPGSSEPQTPASPFSDMQFDPTARTIFTTGYGTSGIGPS